MTRLCTVSTKLNRHKSRLLLTASKSVPVSTVEDILFKQDLVYRNHRIQPGMYVGRLIFLDVNRSVCARSYKLFRDVRVRTSDWTQGVRLWERIRTKSNQNISTEHVQDRIKWADGSPANRRKRVRD